MRLPPATARQWLMSAPVGSLASVDPAGRPHLVPLTFVVTGDRIYSAVDDKPKRSRDLARLRNIRADPRVAVLVDHYDDDWERLWWVRADGRAQVVADESEMAGPIALLADRYPRYRRRRPDGPVIAITVERWSGWAASAAAGPARPIRLPVA